LYTGHEVFTGVVSAGPRRLFCPNCGWNNVRSSQRAGFWDGAAMLLLLSPLRCRNCRLRFYRPWFLARRALPLGVDKSVDKSVARNVDKRTPPPAAVVNPAPVVVPSSAVPAVVPAAVVPALEVPAVEVPRPIILLLDDDPAMRKLLGRLLGREGYEVREASGAGAAAAALRDTEMDLAIVNLSVREEAEQAVRALRSAHADLMVMLLSEALALRETSEDLLILPGSGLSAGPGVSAVLQRVRALLSQDRQQLV
jgi:CheY-like chemotaxis protein